MTTTRDEAKDLVIGDIQAIMTTADKHFSLVISGKKQCGITELSKQVANDLKMNFTLVYSVMTLYKNYRGDLKATRGRYGGGLKYQKNTGNPTPDVVSILETSMDDVGGSALIPKDDSSGSIVIDQSSDDSETLF